MDTLLQFNLMRDRDCDVPPHPRSRKAEIWNGVYEISRAVQVLHRKGPQDKMLGHWQSHSYYHSRPWRADGVYVATVQVWNVRPDSVGAMTPTRTSQSPKCSAGDWRSEANRRMSGPTASRICASSTPSR
jgi:hypothetical protein